MSRLIPFVVSAFALHLALTGSGAAAQELPPPPGSLPIIESVFEPSGFVLPGGPCFEFACFDGAVFDGDTLATRGAVYPGIYIYAADRSGSWTLQAALTPPVASVYDPPREQPPYAPDAYEMQFGTLMALDGDELLATGVYADQTRGVYRAQVYLFRRSGTSWAHVQTLDTSASAIAFDRGTALFAQGAGVAVYERGRDGSYRQRDVLAAPDASDDSQFGATLALDNDRALVGAPLDDAGVGAVYLFERCRFGWQLSQKFSPQEALPSTGFGEGLALSRDRIAIGAPAAPGPDPARPGQVQLYDLRGRRWQATQLIPNPYPLDEGDDWRSFGTVLDMEDRRLLAGGDASYPYAQGWWNYLFELRGGEWRPTAVLNAGRAHHVQLSEGRALVDQKGLRYGSYPVVFDLPR